MKTNARNISGLTSCGRMVHEDGEWALVVVEVIVPESRSRPASHAVVGIVHIGIRGRLNEAEIDGLSLISSVLL